MGNAFSRDGAATTFIENIPVAGYGVALVHVIAGNGDHAKRAVAKSTNSVITAAGAVAGAAAGVAGGPVGIVAGGAAGGAAAAQLGMVTEYGIASTIKDAEVKGNVGELSWERAGKEALLGGLGGAFSGGLGAGALKAAGEKVAEEAGKALLKAGARQTVAQTVAVSSSSLTATRGIFEGKPVPKDPKSRPRRRVCNAAQQAAAEAAVRKCQEVVDVYAMTPVRDAYLQVFIGFEQFVRVGLDWAFADGLVKGQIARLDAKYSGGAGDHPPLTQWVQNDLERIAALGDAVTAGDARIAGMINRKGLEPVYDEILMEMEQAHELLESLIACMNVEEPGDWVPV